MTRNGHRPPYPILVIVVLLSLCVALFAAGCGGDDDDGTAGESELQTVSFQQPDDPGDNPFTDAADVEGDEEVDVPPQPPAAGQAEGQGPFGGTGNNRVCDRDLLIRFLRRNPERLREWASVQGIPQTVKAVTEYIAKLHPVTLTRDTQVTNHNYVNGRAVGYQAILQAGTAVLVDKYGIPVVRCRCGNPLKPPVYIATAQCRGCPENYTPPKPCDYGRRDDYDSSYYRRTDYSNGDYDEVFIRRSRTSRYRDCYTAYPDPPTVTIVDVYEPEARAADDDVGEPQDDIDEPGVQGLDCTNPRSQLEFEQCRDAGSLPEQQAPPPPPPPPPAPPDTSGTIDCANPPSQEAFEQCREAGELPEQQTPPPPPSDGRDPNYDCPDLPPAHPGEDYLRNCG